MLSSEVVSIEVVPAEEVSIAVYFTDVGSKVVLSAEVAV